MKCHNLKGLDVKLSKVNQIWTTLVRIEIQLSSRLRNLILLLMRLGIRIQFVIMIEDSDYLLSMLNIQIQSIDKTEESDSVIGKTENSDSIYHQIVKTEDSFIDKVEYSDLVNRQDWEFGSR